MSQNNRRASRQAQSVTFVKAEPQRETDLAPSGVAAASRPAVQLATDLEEAEEKGKEFKEDKYKEDAKPKQPRWDPNVAVMARVAEGELPLVVEVHHEEAPPPPVLSASASAASAASAGEELRRRAELMDEEDEESCATG